MLWNRVMFVICVFGFLKEFKPSESFISPYLNGHWKNFTEYEINQEIYPVATYSNLALLVIVFLLTDCLRYKPVILLEGIAGIITWTILLLGQSILMIQVSQFFYGLFCATEVAYYSYLYAKTEKKYYQRATSITKATLLVGKASSALISQVLVIFDLMDYHQLNFLTLGAMTLGTIWAIFLPPVSQSTYFHRSKKSNLKNIGEAEDGDETGELKVCVVEHKAEEASLAKDGFLINYLQKKNGLFFQAFAYLVKDLNDSIRNKEILKWCAWWAMSLCGYLQVTYYMQLLWQAIINKDDNDQGVYHGFSNFANCLVGAICTYMVGFLKLKWEIYGEIALAFCAVLQGSILLYGAHSSHLITGYFLYMSFRVLYQTSTTIASAQIARNIKAESYALVFGISTFVALLGQTVLTVVVIDLLKLNITTQFVVYGNYYIAIGIGFVISGIITLMQNSSRKKESRTVDDPAS
ncbi:UNVERIFIED_CONTAM: hypothetical protein PYX00_007839 [Menopon gallinae]|uniref:Thiamine transporter 2 n=1 Tax=Menopon gallinae TaxID=328185 RepID=A0AAW2HKP6_9NEOP